MEWIQNSKSRKALSAFVLLVIVVIYTFYSMNSPEAVSVTVGVDDSKIGIAVDAEEPVFLDLDEIQSVYYTEDFNEEDYPDCHFCADRNLGAFIIVETSDKVYVINTSTRNATKNIYEDIMNAVEE